MLVDFWDYIFQIWLTVYVRVCISPTCTDFFGRESLAAFQKIFMEIWETCQLAERMELKSKRL
jgi:hypothetical protein